jgi:hypothetical protein
MRWSLVLATAATALFAQDPGAAKKPAPAKPEFKLVVRYYHAGPDPIGVGEMVAHSGLIYQFSSELDEFVVINAAETEVELINIKHHVQARITFARIEQAVASLRKKLLRTVEELEKQDARSARISGRKIRDLVEPKFRETFDKATGKLQLTNDSIEVECTGVSDADSPRLALIADAMDTLVKAGALRDPKSVPPFTRLAAQNLLLRQKQLRPTEINILYRLNGPPERKRWTYRLEPALKDRDFIGLARVDRCRREFRKVTLAEYEQHGEN